jgi:D-alanine-D-alanine ligase
MAVLRREVAADRKGICGKLEQALGYPLFVKPANMGSSVGISKVHDARELGPALDLALAFDRKLVVEAAVPDAREIECAVLGNDDPEASGCGEIVPGREFYDYEDKYISDGARLLVPAPLEGSISESVRDLARRAFALCGCAGFARVDFFVDRADGRVFVNELNTLPGFTSISMYPKLWEHAGVSLPELIVRIVSLAKERSESRTRDRAGRAAPKKLG